MGIGGRIRRQRPIQFVGGAAVLREDSCYAGKRFRLSPEWRILIKRLKAPPFRRKPESLCSL
ncbi:MAG: hypothetical protein ACR2QC_02885 [Gammaproteobacteria bacterium]